MPYWFTLAVKDHQLAIFADEGIHEKTGKDFWKEQVHINADSF